MPRGYEYAIDGAGAAIASGLNHGKACGKMLNMELRSARIGIRITPRTRLLLEKRAAQERRTLSTMAEIILSDALEAYVREEETATKSTTKRSKKK